jgi:hypothetical protein
MTPNSYVVTLTKLVTREEFTHVIVRDTDNRPDAIAKALATADPGWAHGRRTDAAQAAAPAALTHGVPAPQRDRRLRFGIRIAPRLERTTIMAEAIWFEPRPMPTSKAGGDRVVTDEELDRTLDELRDQFSEFSAE